MVFHTPSTSPRSSSIPKETLHDLKQRCAESIMTENARVSEYRTPVMTWQSSVDLPTRRVMMQRLLIILKTKGGLSIMSTAEKLPAIVRRLELALYIRAASMSEYLNPNTLYRRVQFLIITLHHQGVSSKKRTTFHGRQKRKLAEVVDCQSLGYREVRPKFIAQHRNPHRNSSRSLFLFENREDIIGHVFSFLDGAQTITCRATNRFAMDFLPNCVYYLRVSSQTLNMLLHPVNTAAHRAQLSSFVNLESLEVFNPSAIETEQASIHKYDARGCSNLPFHSSNDGETIVQELAIGLMAHSNPRLKRLILTSNFVNTSHINAASSIICALKSGSCPQLEALSLAGNYIGDTGAIEVTELLYSQQCPNLKHLDLRKNFIGENGISMISKALKSGVCPLLEELCLGRNITSDCALKILSSAIEAGCLSRLKFLGLEDNFLELEGIRGLAETLKRNKCPDLRELCIGDNSIDNALIHQVFCDVMKTCSRTK